MIGQTASGLGDQRGAIGFPLEPFLVSLAADGIRLSPRDYDRIALALRAWPGGWTGDRIADVLCPLLATSVEMDEVLRRRCAAFFRLPPEAERRFEGIDVPRALAELATVGERQERGQRNGEECISRGKKYITTQTPHRSESNSKDFAETKFPVICSKIRKNAANAVKILVNFILSRKSSQNEKIGILNILIAIIINGIILAKIFENLLTEYIDMIIPDIVYTHEIALYFIKNALTAIISLCILAIGGVLVIIIYVYSKNYWRSVLRFIALHTQFHRHPIIENENYSSIYSIDLIPKPRLSAEGIDTLADGIGRFTSSAVSHVLDVAKTVNASARAGGVPNLCFRLHRRDRQVVVLEDRSAEPLAWNNAVTELVAGLDERGVRVVRGWFRGAPDACFHEDGRELHLDELADHRSGYLLLLCSDSQGVRAEHRPMLEDLARWPCVAWLELRDSQLWDEGTASVAAAGLPVLPASDEGLARLARIHLSEGGGARPTLAPAMPRAVFLDPCSPALRARMDYLLGDALGWAQDCAMVQPINLGLADELRREFHHGVPPERIDRLLALPGTERSTVGITFAQPVLAALADGFKTMRPLPEQERVLDFILDSIRRAEPPKPPEGSTTIAHLLWRWAMARVQLDKDPDAAAAELKRLRKTPLIDSIKDTLRSRSVAASEGDRDGRIPLRMPAKGVLARKFLANLTGETERQTLRQRMRRMQVTLKARFVMHFAAVPLLSAIVRSIVRKLGPVLSESAVGWEIIKELSKGLQCEFSSDGRYFAAANGSVVHIYASATGQIIHRFLHTHVIRWLAFSPSGNALACVSEAGQLSIWSLTEAVTILEFADVERMVMPFAWITDDIIMYYYNYQIRTVEILRNNHSNSYIIRDIAGFEKAYYFMIRKDDTANSNKTPFFTDSNYKQIKNCTSLFTIISKNAKKNSFYEFLLEIAKGFMMNNIYINTAFIAPELNMRDAHWHLGGEKILVKGLFIDGKRLFATRTDGVWTFHNPDESAA